MWVSGYVHLFTFEALNYAFMLPKIGTVGNMYSTQLYILQIMNVYECNGKNIFMRRKIDCSINLSPNENSLTIARIKTFIICFIYYQTIVFRNQFIRHLKQHAFESYFSIWIISHSSHGRNQPKVNYEDRTKSFLTDGNCESAMEKTIALIGVEWNVSIALLKNGTFYLISRDHNQLIKRPKFNEVLYKFSYTSWLLDIIV